MIFNRQASLLDPGSLPYYLTCLRFLELHPHASLWHRSATMAGLHMWCIYITVACYCTYLIAQPS
ncbi:hypothetical protein BDW60DRAFT_186406 [Aspergillus nidulans var. acristatus]